MTKKTLLIILIFLFILLAVGLFIIAGKEGEQGNNGEASSGGGGFLSNLLPFGGGDPDSPRDPTDENNDGGNIGVSGGSLNQVIQLTTVPTAGYVSSSTENGLVVRYVDRELGNVFEISDSLSSRRVTNTTIPAIYDAILSADFGSVIYRYVDEGGVVKTYLATITVPEEESSEPLSIDGVFLNDEIAEIVPNSDHSSVVYLEPARFGIRGRRLDFDGGVSNVFESPFTEWNMEWPNEEILSLTTKPSFFAHSQNFEVNLNDGSFNKIIGNTSGLMVTTNPTGNFHIISLSANDAFTSGLYNSTANRGAEMEPNTLADKCVWHPVHTQIAYCGVPTTIPDGRYPDDWYKGKVSFSDNIVEINVEENSNRVIASPSEIVSGGVDAIKLQVSTDGSTLYFINKKDLTLWSVSLDRPIGISKYEEEEVDEVEEES